MLAKQDDFSGCADKQLSFDASSIRCQLLNCSTYRLSSTKDARTNIFVMHSIELDSTRSNKRPFEVIQQVVRVFDTNAQANEVLW